jgi:transposase
MPQEQVHVTGGVDTHGEQHVAAVLDDTGRLVATAAFSADAAGYRQLLAWLTSFGVLDRVGVEGTGCYGAGLARYLARQDVTVTEVNRPDRQARRRRGKSDPADAAAAARAALNGDATAVPKAGTGPAESLRALRAARRSAMKARTQAANQIAALTVTAPDPVRRRLAGLRPAARIAACARLRPAGSIADPAVAARHALRLLARRHQALTAEVTDLDTAITALCAQASPALLATPGVGPDTASALLATAGDNPGRLRTEASFAALCGASPLPASSGKTTRHRLNRGGDRQANNALWRIAIVRLATDPHTRAYAARRTAEGKTSREIIRCLKRYIAREVYQILTQPPPPLDTQ